MRFDLKTVSLSDIRAGEETYRISTATDDQDSLILSISGIGVINPPILIPDSSGFTIVSGFRRIDAARSLGIQRLACRILDHDTPRLVCVKIAVVDNSFQRRLNPIEVSRALSLLFDCCPREELETVARELGLPASLPLMRKLLLLSKLPVEVQEGIVSEDISPQIAYMLSELDDQVALWFASVFKALKISLNKQKEIITLCREIAIREDLALLDVIKGQVLRDILENPDLDRSAKANKVRTYLKHRRFPALSKARDTFESALKSLKFDGNVKLIPPADFEGMNYSLNLTFQRLSDLETHKKNIDRIASHPGIKDLID